MTNLNNFQIRGEEITDKNCDNFNMYTSNKSYLPHSIFGKNQPNKMVIKHFFSKDEVHNLAKTKQSVSGKYPTNFHRDQYFPEFDLQIMKTFPSINRVQPAFFE